MFCSCFMFLSSIVTTLLKEEGAGCLAILCFVVCVLCTACHGLFTFPLGVMVGYDLCITETHLFKYIQNFTSKS